MDDRIGRGDTQANTGDTGHKADGAIFGAIGGDDENLASIRAPSGSPPLAPRAWALAAMAPTRTSRLATRATPAALRIARPIWGKDVGGGIELFADADDVDVRKGARNAGDNRVFLCLRRAGYGDFPQIGAVQGMGVQHNQKVGAELPEIDLARAGDDDVQIPAEDRHRDFVADFYAGALSDVVVDNGPWRAVVTRWPPLPLGQFAFGWRG